MSTARKTTVSLDNLPEEVLLSILTFLDAKPPSFLCARDEPSIASLESEAKPLKILSTVSHKWRRLVLPFLFQYMRLLLEDVDPFWNDMFNGLPIFFTLAWGHRSLPTALDVFEFVDMYNLTELATSLVVYTNRIVALDILSEHGDQVVSLWDKVLQHFNPTRLVIIAPPLSLAGLTACHTDTADAWAFRIPYQRIELRTQRCDIPTFPISLHESVFDMRYWVGVLLIILCLLLFFVGT